MSSYLKTKNAYDCSGCGACSIRCPQNCISMMEQDDGFAYPYVNTEICISCHLCEKVCPYENAPELTAPLEINAVVAKNKTILANSSSGGVFRILSETVIDAEGVVFGATLDENLQCQHIEADSIDGLVALQKSKYVQSDARLVFDRVLELLHEGRTVLFVGTPCQVAGLRNLAGEKKGKLYTVDIACHGVPSQNDFNQYVRYLEEKYKGKLQSIDFRYKWPSHWGHQLAYEIDGEKKRCFECKPFESPYYYLFLHGKNFRKSCYQCRYARLERVGDITLADCWGLKQSDVSFDITNGVSAVTLNTQQGADLFSMIRESVDLKSIERELLIQFNQPFREPCTEHADRDELVKRILTEGYKDSKAYMSTTTYAKEIVKAAVPSSFKTKLRRIASALRG